MLAGSLVPKESPRARRRQVSYRHVCCISLCIRRQVSYMHVCYISLCIRRQVSYMHVCYISLCIPNPSPALAIFTKNTTAATSFPHFSYRLNKREGMCCTPSVWGCTVVSGLPRAPGCYNTYIHTYAYVHNTCIHT
jgi:hypothetical protein